MTQFRFLAKNPENKSICAELAFVVGGTDSCFLTGSVILIRYTVCCGV